MYLYIISKNEVWGQKPVGIAEQENCVQTREPTNTVHITKTLEDQL